jgi:hypothetical protein
MQVEDDGGHTTGDIRKARAQDERDERHEVERPRARAAAEGELLNLPGRALGKPLWIQPQDEADDDETVIVQLDARFADIELGDRGVMYVLTGGALWQSH